MEDQSQVPKRDHLRILETGLLWNKIATIILSMDKQALDALEIPLRGIMACAPYPIWVRDLAGLVRNEWDSDRNRATLKTWYIHHDDLEYLQIMDRYFSPRAI